MAEATIWIKHVEHNYETIYPRASSKAVSNKQYELPLYYFSQLAAYRHVQRKANPKILEETASKRLIVCVCVCVAIFSAQTQALARQCS